MFGKHKTDVLVVGAGPVGMMTALLLAERGVAVELIESQWRTTSRSYALALHPSTLESFDDLGIAGELVAKGYRLDTLAFYEGLERRAEVRFAELEGDFPFVLVLPQQALEETLEKRLAEHKVKVKWNHRLARLELDGERALARIEKLAKESTGYSVSATGWVVDKVIETEAAYVVGTDGHNSAVRRALDLDFPDLGGAQFFGVFELASNAAAGHEVRVVLDETSTNVLWPLGDQRFRWSFQLEDTWAARLATRPKSRLSVQIGEQSFPHLDREGLDELLAARAPWFAGEISDIAWSVGVRFERRLAEHFGRGVAWLAGDAAHLTTPVGVHSMNVGLREGRDLAQAITEILRHGASPDLLADYDVERLEEWRRLLATDGGPVAAESASPWVKAHAAQILSVLPASGPDLEALLAQLGLDLEPVGT